MNETKVSKSFAALNARPHLRTVAPPTEKRHAEKKGLNTGHVTRQHIISFTYLACMSPFEVGLHVFIRNIIGGNGDGAALRQKVH